MKTKKYCKVLFYYLPTLPSFKLGDVGSTISKLITLCNFMECVIIL